MIDDGVFKSRPFSSERVSCPFVDRLPVNIKKDNGTHIFYLKRGKKMSILEAAK